MSLELIMPDWPAPPAVRAAVTPRAGGVPQETVLTAQG